MVWRWLQWWMWNHWRPKWVGIRLDRQSACMDWMDSSTSVILKKSRNKAWFQMLSGGPQPVLYWAQGCHSYLLLGLDVLQPLCQVSGGLFNSMVLGCHLLSAFWYCLIQAVPNTVPAVKCTSCYCATICVNGEMDKMGTVNKLSANLALPLSAQIV